MSRKRRSFSGEFKARVVLELLCGQRSKAEICREHRLSPQLVDGWKRTFLANAPKTFDDPDRKRDKEKVAQLERMVGRLTMQVEILKEASALFDADPTAGGR